MKIIKNVATPADFQPIELLITLESQEELDALTAIATHPGAVSLFLAHNRPPLFSLTDAGGKVVPFNAPQLTAKQAALSADITHVLDGFRLALRATKEIL